MLTISEITCAYPGAEIFKGLTLHLDRGEIGALLGPSGCGKTTLLRAIAGFIPLQAGQISLRGNTVANRDNQLPPEKRRMGVVFQDYALFPHLTVARNIAFGLQHLSRQERQAKVARLLELTDLTRLSAAFPHELSGGQQQRVALARALAPEPDLILLDEPFSNLDAELRSQLAQEVKHILRTSHTTALLVTHDQQEAFALADKIGVLQGGHLHQWDTPFTLYHSPMTRFVASFIGRGAFIKGTMLSPTRAETALGILDIYTPQIIAPGSTVDVLIRPDDLEPFEASAYKAQVIDKTFMGATMNYQFQFSDGTTQLECVTPSHHNYPVGEMVGLRLATQRVIGFPETN
ncbi:MAG: ABC transporter ATP-binding protein [Hahellaceae bacterium]|jgi:iron(III) transport system ATP-binding protein|nr:ABC transporter ATP-binding protein [Hahellaceae bacterium]